MVKSTSLEAHYTIFCISLFLPPSHTKYSALTNPQSVFFSWCKTPNFTPTQNDSNNVSLYISTCNIVNWMVASIAWIYSALFFSKFTALNFCQDLTYMKWGLWQSDSGTVQAMWHKLQIAWDFIIKTAQNPFCTT